jgi:hypothetical protein
MMAIAREIVLKQVLAADRIAEIESHLNLLTQALSLGPWNEAAQWNADQIKYHLDELKRVFS